MIRRLFMIVMIMSCVASLAHAQELRVVLEPFPPFVNADGSGIVPTMLQRVEAETGYTFTFETMPFNRARQMLMQGEADILGIVAKGLDSPDFYEKCQDMEWGFRTMSDMYAADASVFDSLEGKIIGTPDGNEGLAADVLGVDLGSVQSASLDSLFKMLDRGRLDVVWFARDASMSTIRDLNLSFAYQALPPEGVDAGLAVPNTPEGLKIGEAVSKALSAIDLATEFPAYGELLTLPESGFYPR